MESLLRKEESGLLCLRTAATTEDLDWIFQLQIATYSPQYAVARQMLERWYHCNPNGFSVLELNGRNVGHITFVPLRPNIIERFVKGTLVEQELHEDCL